MGVVENIWQLLLLAVEPRQLLPKLAFALCNFFRNLHLHFDVKIAARAGAARQAASAQPEALATTGARWNLQTDMTFERRDLEFRAENRLPWINLDLVNQIAAFDPKIRVPGQTNAQE